MSGEVKKGIEKIIDKKNNVKDAITKEKASLKKINKEIESNLVIQLHKDIQNVFVKEFKGIVLDIKSIEEPEKRVNAWMQLFAYGVPKLKQIEIKQEIVEEQKTTFTININNV